MTPATVFCEALMVLAAASIISAGRGWEADRDALERVVAGAVRWCLTVRPDIAVTVQPDASPDLIVQRGDSALNRVKSLMHQGFATRLRSIAHDRYRAIAFDASNGRLSLLEGGLRLHRDGWHPATQSIQALLYDHAGDLVYGYVDRSHDHHAALHAESYGSGRGFARLAAGMADHLAPDVYGIQLLGPRYSPNIPRHPDWRSTALPAGRTLLSHVDLPAWLDEIKLHDAIHDELVSRQSLRAQARETLAAILLPEPQP